nr:tetratricopeptide repeat protein [Merismopedia glauca]
MEINPRYALAFYNRGLVRQELKQHSEALADYTKAIEINPQYALAYYQRGLVRYELKDKRGAIEDLQRVTEILPTTAQLFSDLGRMDDYQKARDILRKAQKMLKQLQSQ